MNGAFMIIDPNTTDVNPYKNNNIVNGVTTFDAVLVTKHILGTQPLGSPYKIIAGDVNRNNAVTTFDIVEMRKIILGIYTDSIPNNTSWRFIPSDFTFPNPANPFASAFPEFITVNVFPPSGDLDFIGLKVADANNSANPDLTAAQTEERNLNGSLLFHLPGLFLKKGEIVPVPFQLESTPIHGYQFALDYQQESLELLEIKPGFSAAENFALHPGILKTSWHTGTPFTPVEPAFTLVFRAKSDGWLSDWLQLAPDALPAEAYNEDLDFLQPALVFKENAGTNSHFRLIGSRPNPFVDKTRIGFELPANGTVEITVFDIRGVQVFSQKLAFEKGKNEFQVKAAELPGRGVYYYRLQSVFGTVEGKLIRL